MYRIIEEKEIKKFIKNINDINQKMKNSRNNSFYTLNNSTAYSIRPAEDYNIGICKVDLLQSKDLNLNGIVDGKELYKYISIYKKSIDEIIIEEKYFSIKCNKLKLDFSSISFNRKNKEINEYRLYRKKYNDYIKPLISKK